MPTPSPRADPDRLEGHVRTLAEDLTPRDADHPELARLLDGMVLPYPVDLVSYPLEEPPYFYTDEMGSAVHAQALKERGVAVRAMLALEMIGYFTDASNSQQFPLSVLRPFYPSEGNFIAVVGKWGWGQRRLVRTIRGGCGQRPRSRSTPSTCPGLCPASPSPTTSTTGTPGTTQ